MAGLHAVQPIWKVTLCHFDIETSTASQSIALFRMLPEQVDCMNICWRQHISDIDMNYDIVPSYRIVHTLALHTDWQLIGSSPPVGQLRVLPEAKRASGLLGDRWIYEWNPLLHLALESTEDDITDASFARASSFTARWYLAQPPYRLSAVLQYCKII